MTTQQSAAASLLDETPAAGARQTGELLFQAARRLLRTLERGERMERRALREAMTDAFGLSDARGGWSWKEAYDAAEGAMTLFLLRYGRRILRSGLREGLGHVQRAARLEPPHTYRSEEQIRMQQFSTPLGLAYAVAAAARIEADDLVLEPSAGTGTLAVMAGWRLEPERHGRLLLNELARNRADLLARLFPQVAVTRLNGEHIGHLLETEPWRGGHEPAVLETGDRRGGRSRRRSQAPAIRLPAAAPRRAARGRHLRPLHPQRRAVAPRLPGRIAAADRPFHRRGRRSGLRHAGNALRVPPDGGRQAHGPGKTTRVGRRPARARRHRRRAAGARHRTRAAPAGAARAGAQAAQGGRAHTAGAQDEAAHARRAQLGPGPSGSSTSRCVTKSRPARTRTKPDRTRPGSRRRSACATPSTTRPRSCRRRRWRPCTIRRRSTSRPCRRPSFVRAGCRRHNWRASRWPARRTSSTCRPGTWSAAPGSGASAWTWRASRVRPRSRTPGRRTRASTSSKPRYGSARRGCWATAPGAARAGRWPPSSPGTGCRAGGAPCGCRSPTS